MPSSPRPTSLLDRVLLVAGLVIVAALFVATPGSLLDKADHIGYGVCHQIPVRSPFFDGRQLPLCARCSGQFLGALFGLIFLLARRRGQAGLLPPKQVLVVLAVFLMVWAFDGLNSYLTFFPSLPHLYEPTNLLRTTTGALQGVALISLAWPFFNVTLWARPAARPSVMTLRELGGLTGIAAAIVLAVGSEWAPLLYPLALLSVGGVLTLLTLVNTMLLALLLRREALAHTVRDALPLVVAGLALGLLELLAINWVRAALTDRWNLPF